MPEGFDHPKTRTHVRLLGPCFKTGRMKSYDRQQPKRIVCHLPRDDRQQFKRTASSPLWSTIDRARGRQPKIEHALRRLCRARAGAPRTITLPPKDKLPFRGTFRPVPTAVDALRREVRRRTPRVERQRSIRIREAPVPSAHRLNLDEALLIPCASLLTVSRTI